MMLMVLAASGACAKKTPMVSAPVPMPVDAVAPPPPPPDAAPAAAPERELTEDEIFARKSLDQLNAERPLGAVFFQLDDNTLSDAARATLQRNADWLRRWTSTRTTIEGHCDDRGTGEYNLALGERRAHAVKAYLVGLGIDADRLLIVSRGEESPVCGDQHEGCWSRNRRAQPIITAK